MMMEPPSVGGTLRWCCLDTLLLRSLASASSKVRVKHSSSSFSEPGRLFPPPRYPEGPPGPAADGGGRTQPDTAARLLKKIHGFLSASKNDQTFAQNPPAAAGGHHRTWTGHDACRPAAGISRNDNAETNERAAAGGTSPSFSTDGSAGGGRRGGWSDPAATPRASRWRQRSS